MSSIYENYSGSFSASGSGSVKSVSNNHYSLTQTDIIAMYFAVGLFLCCLLCLLGLLFNIIFLCIKDECEHSKRIRRMRRDNSNDTFDIDSHGRYQNGSDFDSDSDYDIEKGNNINVDIDFKLDETSWDNISIKSTQQTCPICMNEIETFNKVVKLTCSHIYHQECINTWLQEKKKSSTCPICREYII